MSDWRLIGSVPFDTEVLLTDGYRRWVGEVELEIGRSGYSMSTDSFWRCQGPYLRIWDHEGRVDCATHWAPLPELP